MVVVKMIFSMTPLDKLIAHFEKFPGTGIRQARRFAFHILTLKPEQADELAGLVTSLKNSVVLCPSCYRYYSESGERQPLCSICRNPNRDRSKLLVVARDSDTEAIERSGVYDGLYFILGGTVSLLHNPKDEQRVRSGALLGCLTTRLKEDHLMEVILGFSVSPDGENTARFVENHLEPVLKGTAVSLTHLGRGLSTGSELEYADPETIKSALQSRTK